jgi:transcriptional regulator with XRE-family HTH domain
MVIGMDYPVIDPVGTGSNIRNRIRNSGNSIADVGRMLGIADMSTMYKWLRGDSLPGIDNMLALSMLLGVSINDILVTK